MEMADADDVAAAEISQRFLSRPTAKDRLLLDIYHTPDTRFQPVCDYLTLEECAAAKGQQMEPCEMIHFEVIQHPHTEPSMGHCSFLNTCHKGTKCKFLHFRPVRHPRAKPFEWKTIYDDDPFPKRAKGAAAIVAASQQQGQPGQHQQQQRKEQQQHRVESILGDAQLTLEGDERLYVETLVRHPARALFQHGLAQWTRAGEAISDSNAKKDLGSRQDGELPPPQAIRADLSRFDLSMLGKFDVVMADPPWDIHMSLPFGTVPDAMVRALPIPQLQDEGLLFLWVTGRALELGRELLAQWGYTRVDEIVWVKLGQTQRLIRTGMTGHWLNHTKEHCLVGAKRAKRTGDQEEENPVVASPLPYVTTTYPGSHAAGTPAPIPDWVHRGLDADVVVTEVRDTSWKPDELYSIIERLCPMGRKVELFGREHNTRPGWITIGDQIKSDVVHDEALKARLAQWWAKNGTGTVAR